MRYGFMFVTGICEGAVWWESNENLRFTLVESTRDSVSITYPVRFMIACMYLVFHP